MNTFQKSLFLATILTSTFAFITPSLAHSTTQHRSMGSGQMMSGQNHIMQGRHMRQGRHMGASRMQHRQDYRMNKRASRPHQRMGTSANIANDPDFIAAFADD